MDVPTPSLYITGAPEGPEREKGIKNVFEKNFMAENFPNLKKETDIRYRKYRGS